MKVRRRIFIGGKDSNQWSFGVLIIPPLERSFEKNNEENLFRFSSINDIFILQEYRGEKEDFYSQYLDVTSACSMIFIRIPRYASLRNPR